MIKKFFEKLDGIPFFNKLFSFIGKFTGKKLTVSAAGIAFYFFISIIPICVLLCSQLPFTGISKDVLTQSICEIAPSSMSEVISSVINQAYSMRISVFSVSVIFLTWSSSKLMLALIRALDRIYSRNERRNYFTMLGNSIVYTVLMIVLVCVALLIVSRRGGVEKLISVFFPTNEDLINFAKKGYRALSFVMFVLFFALLYKFLPYGKRKFRYQLPGAALASLLIFLFSLYFSFYSQRGNIYVSFYGSLANIALFMVWIYMCINIFLMGAVFNFEYVKKKDVYVNKNSKGFN